MSTQKKVVIYTDGGCRGNPGEGSFGAILLYKENIKELTGYIETTTNNKMELLAAVVALDTLKHPCNVELWTDSKYLKDGVTKWIEGWKRKNWIKSDKKPVANVLLWKKIDELVNYHTVEFKWVKGHSGHDLNEKVDQLCNLTLDNKSPKIESKYMSLLDNLNTNLL